MTAPSIVGVSPTPSSTGNPINSQVTVLFDREVDISRINEGSFFVEGPDYLITTGPDQALKVDKDPTTLDDLVNESDYRGVIKGTFTFARVNNTSNVSGAYFDYAGSVTAFRHKVIFTPEKPLHPSTTYTVYITGDDDSSDDYRTGVTTRTVFDVVLGTNVGTSLIEATGGYTGGINDTFEIEITGNGAPGTATYRWWKGSVPGIVYDAISSTGPRLLADGVYIRFYPGGNYVTGDTYSFVVRAPEYIATTYTFTFTTGATEFTSVPETSTLLTTISSEESSEATPSTTEDELEVVSTIPAIRATSLAENKMTDIVIEFSNDIVNNPTNINQIEIIREAVDGNIGVSEPAYMTYTYVLSGDTLTLTMTGDFYETNRVYTVIVPDFLEDVDGNTLGEDYEFYFTSTYTSMYTTLRRIRLEYGRLLANVADDAINLAIYIASRVIDSLVPATFSTSNSQFWVLAKQEFATCYAVRLLLLGLNSSLSGDSVSGSGSKRLDDLAIDKGSLSASAFTAEDLLARLDDCIAVWLVSIQSGGLIGPNNPLMPQMTVKGETDPDRPVFGRIPMPGDARVPALNSKEIAWDSRRARHVYRKRTV